MSLPSKSRDNTSKLSERIANIAKKLLKQHFSKSHFPQLLITTEDHECVKNLLTTTWNSVSYIRDASFLLLESGLKKAETDAEKHVYNELKLRIKLINQEKDEVFKLKVDASNDNTHRSKLVPQETWLFAQYLTKHANNGTINELIIITFSIILFRCEARRIFTESSSSVKPNFLSEFWFSNNFESFVQSFQQIIDARQSQITADEEKHLIDLVKQTIAYAHVSIRLSWMHRNDKMSPQIKLSK